MMSKQIRRANSRVSLLDMHISPQSLPGLIICKKIQFCGPYLEVQEERTAKEQAGASMAISHVSDPNYRRLCSPQYTPRSSAFCNPHDFTEKLAHNYAI